MRNKVKKLLFPIIYGIIAWIVITSPAASTCSDIQLFCLGCLTIFGCLIVTEVLERVFWSEEKEVEE